MRALVIATADKHGNVTGLPPMDPADSSSPAYAVWGDVCLHYDYDPDGVPHAGGYSCLGETPATTGVPTQGFWVEADSKTVDAIKATCLVVETLPDAEQPNPPEETLQETVAAWLTTTWTAAKPGLSPTAAAALDTSIVEVAKEQPADVLGGKQVVLKAHAITDKQWTTAGGTLKRIPTYYFDATLGSDSGAGTIKSPFQTIDMANSIKSSGSRVLFKAGSAWRGTTLWPQSGIYYGRYGTGAKPIISIGVDKGLTDDWKDGGHNLWSTTALVDVGNVMDGLIVVGTKKFTKAVCTAQGDYYWDDLTNTCWMYSTSNPAMRYGSDLVLTMNGKAIQVASQPDVTIDGLHITQSNHGIEGYGAVRWIIRNCDVSWIGGCVQYEQYRYGNGIQFWDGGIDTLVEHCRFWEIYDAAMTCQGSAANVWRNQIFRNNLVWNCEYGWEVFAEHSGCSEIDIQVTHNTFYNCGAGWGHKVRFDPTGRGFCCWHDLAGTKTGLIFRDNIIVGSVANHAYFYADANIGSWLLDYNCYYPDKTSAFLSYVTGYTFAQWKTHIGQESHSVLGDPLFKNVSALDFTLQTGSCAKGTASDGGNMGAL